MVALLKENVRSESQGENAMTIRLPRRLLIGLLSLLVAIFATVFITEFFDTDYSSPDIQNKCTKSGAQDPKNTLRPVSGTIKTIRLTNQGEFVNRCELTDVLDEIMWDTQPTWCSDPIAWPMDWPPHRSSTCLNVKSGESIKPKLIVLFVHGWMHNATDEDTNHDKFTKLIKSLEDTNPQKQVLGVYVTWNASTGNAFLDYFSFWSRQRRADRITQSAILTKIVGSIGSSRGRSGQRDYFIAIGHSFGARMLFAAVNAPFVLGVENAYPPPGTSTYQTIRGPADAVVLVNPAFEAARYSTLDDIIRNEEAFRRDQQPLMITVSTDNDCATRLAFPFGQMIDLAFDKRARTTLGNYEGYYTHSLLSSDESQCSGSKLSNFTEDFLLANLCLKREPRWHLRRNTALDRDPRGWSDVTSKHQIRNPFLVVHTNKKVIDNHGGFWDSNDHAFSVWLFRMLDALAYCNDNPTECVTTQQSHAE